MTITVTERINVQAGNDRFEVVVNGSVFSTHPTRSGAEKLAARLATGELTP